MSRIPSAFRRVARNVTAAACALLFFYGVPLTWDFGLNDGPRALIGLGCFVIGVAGLGALVWRQVVRLTANGDSAEGRVDGVLLVICIVVVFFALFYDRLETANPGEFNGMSTRTDALYYTLVTLGTVGYGDVNAVGQIARVATMVQIVFDFVVLGTLVAILGSTVTQRLAKAQPKANVSDARDTSESNSPSTNPVAPQEDSPN
ncbi:potassium channel family protein [Nocardia camponoti]|uniref:Membrane protein n=1 Tax=Nocardia camponoti TaxID=1616106 RepID=A0A917QGC9_9NOCA|nr:potassium channel family protein [Nocardia camponoti]GGK49530.1 membrane protein [Nocardia camponoti]